MKPTKEKTAKKVHAAVKQKDWEALLALLVKHPKLPRKPDASCYDIHRCSLLNCAMEHWWTVEEVTDLLAYDVDLDLIDGMGLTPLMFAAPEFYLPGHVDLFLQRGADVRIRNAKKNTALHYAGWWESPVYVTERLLQAGADPTAANEDGETPMHWVATHRELDRESILAKFRLLIQHGGDPFAKDKNGITPLGSDALDCFDHDARPWLVRVLDEEGLL